MLKKDDEWLSVGDPLCCAGCHRHVPVYEVIQHWVTESLEYKHGSDGNNPVLWHDAELLGDSVDEHFYCKRCISKGKIHGEEIRKE